jgi:hypothetical protein
MKIILARTAMLILGITIGLAPAAAQSSTEKASPATKTASKPADSAGSRIDPQKEADIRLLMDLVGTKRLMEESLSRMEVTIRPLLTKSLPEGEYREKLVQLFFEKLRANFNPDALMQEAVAAYDKHLTHEDVKGLIAFYRTPLGQKAVEVLPQLTSEMAETGRKIGEELGRRSMLEVLAEHPDLANAMDEAGKQSSPQP